MLAKFCDLLYQAVAQAVAKGIADGVAQGAQAVTGEPVAPAVIEVEPSKLWLRAPTSIRISTGHPSTVPETRPRDPVSPRPAAQACSRRCAARR